MGAKTSKVKAADAEAAAPAEAEPVETVAYFRHEDGAVSRIVSTGTTDSVAVPEGAVAISEEEHASTVQAYTTVHEGYIEGLRKTETEQQGDDYAALRAAGIPAATAQRLTGYVPAEG